MNQKGQILQKIILGFVFIIIYMSMLVAIPTVVDSLAASSLNNTALVQYGASIKLLIQLIYLIMGVMILVFIVSPGSPPQGNYGQSGVYQ